MHTAKSIAEFLMISKRDRANYETFQRTLGLCCHFISEPGWGPVATAAMGILRSVNTARLCPVAAVRLKAYSPWKLCQLIERCLAECDILTMAAIDEWLRGRKGTL